MSWRRWLQSEHGGLSTVVVSHNGTDEFFNLFVVETIYNICRVRYRYGNVLGAWWKSCSFCSISPWACWIHVETPNLCLYLIKRTTKMSLYLRPPTALVWLQNMHAYVALLWKCPCKLGCSTIYFLSWYRWHSQCR